MGFVFDYSCFKALARVAELLILYQEINEGVLSQELEFNSRGVSEILYDGVREKGSYLHGPVFTGMEKCEFGLKFDVFIPYYGW